MFAIVLIVRVFMEEHDRAKIDGECLTRLRAPGVRRQVLRSLEHGTPDSWMDFPEELWGGGLSVGNSF